MRWETVGLVALLVTSMLLLVLLSRREPAQPQRIEVTVHFDGPLQVQMMPAKP
jgi:hypothetical protein